MMGGITITFLNKEINFQNFLTTKEKILNVTGPDALAKAIFMCINNDKRDSY